MQRSCARRPTSSALREKLLFQDYPLPRCRPENRDTIIGLPRVLSFWETLPFWSTFLRGAGLSGAASPTPAPGPCTRAALSAVTSDTVCFPAKLVHGHLRNLAQHKVDRIFMPSSHRRALGEYRSHQPVHVRGGKGLSLCGRQLRSIRRSQWGIPYDAPLFHWYTNEDRNRPADCLYEGEVRDLRGLRRQAAMQAARRGPGAQFHREA